MSIWLKALALWCGILVLAIINGTLREKVLIPAFGNVVALVASGSILAVCVFLVAWAGAPWYGPLTPRHCFLIGCFWLVLTLAFEFSFGLLAQHKSWSELLEAYTFKGGNIWPLVLLATCGAPRLAAKLRGFI